MTTEAALRENWLLAYEANIKGASVVSMRRTTWNSDPRFQAFSRVLGVSFFMILAAAAHHLLRLLSLNQE